MVRFYCIVGGSFLPYNSCLIGDALNKALFTLPRSIYIDEFFLTRSIVMGDASVSADDRECI